MANRHANKKLRAAIRARMASTGETYQQAREALRAWTAREAVRLGTAREALRPRAAHEASRPTTQPPKTDLVACSYFGVPGVVATMEMQGRAFAVLIPSALVWGRGYPHPFPLAPLRAAMRTRGTA
jgi:hypothetical protein